LVGYISIVDEAAFDFPRRSFLPASPLQDGTVESNRSSLGLISRRVFEEGLVLVGESSWDFDVLH